MRWGLGVGLLLAIYACGDDDSPGDAGSDARVADSGVDGADAQPDPDAATDADLPDSGEDARVDAGRDEFGFSVEDGYLTIHSGLGGTAQVDVHWSPSFANTDDSLADVQTYRLSLGSESGTYELGTLNLADTPLPATVVATVDGLEPDTTYYIGVSTINSADIEGAVAEVAAVARTPVAPCETWEFEISESTTISDGGTADAPRCWRVAEAFSGTITIAADHVELSGQGLALTPSGGSSCIVLSGDRVGLNIHDIECQNDDGEGHFIDASGLSSMSGLRVSQSAYTTPRVGSATNAGIDCDGADLGRARIFENSATLQSRSGTGRDAMWMQDCRNFIAWSNTISIDPDSTSTARDGGYSDVDDAWIIGDRFSATRCAQCTYLSNRNRSTGTKYIAHGMLSYSAMHDASHRMIFFDGDDNAMVLYNTCDLSHGSGIGRCIRLRAATAAENHVYGYNTVSAVDGSNAFLNIGGQSESPGPPFPGVTHFYNNDGSGVGDIELSSEWTGRLSTWANVQIDDVQGTGLDEGGDWDSNDDEITDAVRMPTSDDVTYSFRAFQSYTLDQVTGQSSHIEIVDTWSGYDPTTKTPQAPTVTEL